MQSVNVMSLHLCKWSNSKLHVLSGRKLLPNGLEYLQEMTGGTYTYCFYMLKKYSLNDLVLGNDLGTDALLFLINPCHGGGRFFFFVISLLSPI